MFDIFFFFFFQAEDGIRDLIVTGVQTCALPISGGQQQRVAIARALVNEPDLLLADEPTGNLDPRSAQEVMEIFQTLNRSGRTIVLVTHDKEIAAHCNRIARIEAGRIVSDESVAQPKDALQEAR